MTSATRAAYYIYTLLYYGIPTYNMILRWCKIKFEKKKK